MCLNLIIYTHTQHVAVDPKGTTTHTSEILEADFQNLNSSFIILLKNVVLQLGLRWSLTGDLVR
jgi:hypothetical protein